jgi:UDP-2,3-diacylglucosamine pyrophosphatase LpxH
MERLVVILSDIEMSSGDQYDDFPHTGYMSQFLDRYNQGNYTSQEIDLVFNGDIFDFLKMDVDGKFPHLIDSEVALHKLNRVRIAHADFFVAVEKFLSHGNRARRVHFITGNHDMELLFPEVQREIISLCGGSGQIFFPGFTLDIGDLHIEHGNQIDNLFAIDPGKPFLNYRGKKILNLPWATVTLLNAVLPNREDFYELDRIKPRNEIFDEIPSFKEFALSLLWNYWTGDYLKDYFRSNDPLKKVSWSMLKEAFKRSFFFFNADVELENLLHKKMEKSSEYKVYVLGHTHDPKLVSFGDRKIIQAGCFRDEFMMDSTHTKFTLIPKSYVEVRMKRNMVIATNMLEVEGPDIDPTRVPKSLHTYHDVLNQKLGPADERLKSRIDIENQEIKEAKESEDIEPEDN